MSTTPRDGYGLIIKTNSYTGNFEREICAFLTGKIGECEVGKKMKDILEIPDGLFENIMNVGDEHGCYRPVSVHEGDSNWLLIFFEDKPTKEQIQWIKDHAPEFDKYYKTVGRMAEFNKKNPVIEINGYELEQYISTSKRIKL